MRFYILLLNVFISQLLYSQYVLQLEDIDYKLENGTLSIKKYLNEKERNVKIPEVFVVEGVAYQVTKIESFAFSYLDVYNVVLPLGLIEIDSYAFTGSRLSQIEIPLSIQKIGLEAFSRNRFYDLRIPERTFPHPYNIFNGYIEISLLLGNLFLEDLAFYGNRISQLTLPSRGVKYGAGVFNKNQVDTVNNRYSNGMFYLTDSIGHVDSTVVVSYGGKSGSVHIIPSEVKEIASKAFSKCGLWSVNIPESVTQIASDAFNENHISEMNGHHSKGLIFKRHNSSVFDSTTLVGYGGNSHDLDFIPPQVTSISEEAFANCELSYVKVPDNVRYIGDEAFCQNEIERLDISGNVETFGRGVFSRNEIKEINGKPSNGLIFGNRNGTIDSSTIVSYGGDASLIDFIPTTVKHIGRHAFDGCWRIDSVVLPQSIEVIDTAAFAYLLLKTIAIPDGVEYIGENAFCVNSISELRIPSSVKEIGESAFNGNMMRSLVLENGLQSIGAYAFDINNLEELSVPESVTNIGDFAFSHNSIRELTISDSLKHMGKAAFNGNKIETFNGEKSSGIIYGLDEKGRIDYTLISSYGGGADVIDFIPSHVKVIGNSAFAANKIKRVELPSSVKVIEKKAFAYNEIKEIVIPKTVEVLADSVFYSNPEIRIVRKQLLMN